MPIRRLKREIKKHTPFDWFAMLVLSSAVFVIASVITSKVEEFSKEMDTEAERLRADIIYLQNLNNLRHK
jgi:hypothetical protein